jgi:Uma2 family endonuclease
MATKAALSVEEYLRTSFPGVDPEYRDGEIVERSLPDYSHGKIQVNIGAFFKAHRKILNLFPGSEVRLPIRPGRFIIPDVTVFWPHEPPASPPKERPLIVIEILSPDDRMSDVRVKLQEYTDWGVPHIWLVDPATRSLYSCTDGLHEVQTFHLPEVNLTVTPADIFD